MSYFRAMTPLSRCNLKSKGHGKLSMEIEKLKGSLSNVAGNSKRREREGTCQVSRTLLS